MDLKREIKAIVTFSSLFLFLYLFPSQERILQGLREGVLLLSWYAKEHVLYCLIPAFFIAGAIATFISKQSVLKYLGPSSPKILSFSIASISGTVLAVCSCTVLPLFAGLYLRGAGLGPAIAFLYSGPAINVLAIVLTAKVLGYELGVARALGSVSMGIVLGIIMHFLFRESERTKLQGFSEPIYEKSIPFIQSLTFFSTLVTILLIATSKLTYKFLFLYILFLILLIELYLFFKVSSKKLLITTLLLTFVAILSPHTEISYLLGVILLSYIANTSKGLLNEWFDNTYILAKQIFPLLFVGVFLAGFFLGGYEGEGYIPRAYIEAFLGGTGIDTHIFSALVTALMYFATLTEVPIIQALMSQGVKIGPALTMLLAGPAISLPSILVLKSIIGPKKTLVYTILVILVSALYGYIYQQIFG